MRFGLTNTPSIFQRFMNKVLHGLINKGVIMYINDILIYSEIEEEHEALVKEVLDHLRQYDLAAKLENCKFHVTQVEFLGYILGKEGLQIDPVKVKEIQEWTELRSVKEVQSFLGF